MDSDSNRLLHQVDWSNSMQTSKWFHYHPVSWDQYPSRFGCPNKIITDNAAAFRSKKMVSFCHKFHIILGHSTAYYPQGNGLAESSNKSLINMIKKVLEENKRKWHKKLVNALWEDRLTTKRSIGVSPYELVYGLEAKFPSSLLASWIVYLLNNQVPH